MNSCKLETFNTINSKIDFIISEIDNNIYQDKNLSIQLFPEEENHFTKYNQKQNKTITYNRIKAIHSK